MDFDFSHFDQAVVFNSIMNTKAAAFKHEIILLAYCRKKYGTVNNPKQYCIHDVLIFSSHLFLSLKGLLFLFSLFLSPCFFAKNILLCFICLAIQSFQISLSFFPFESTAWKLNSWLPPFALTAPCDILGTHSKVYWLSKAHNFSHSPLFLLLAILAILCVLNV